MTFRCHDAHCVATDRAAGTLLPKIKARDEYQHPPKRGQTIVLLSSLFLPAQPKRVGSTSYGGRIPHIPRDILVSWQLIERVLAGRFWAGNPI